MALIGNQVTISASAQALTAGSESVETLIVKAHTSNTGTVFVGPSGTTILTGYPVYPGEEFILTPAHGGLAKVPRPNEVYVIGTVSDKISWLGTRK